MREYIDFIDWHESLVRFFPKWWDRPRWWMVRLLGGQCPFDSVKITRVPVNGKDVIDRLLKQKRKLVESFSREPKTLLIGGCDYAELMSCAQVREQFTVYADFHYGKHEIYGLTIKVIPWMRGMIVLPNGIL